VYRKVFKFKGGHLALDFCNTVHWHKRPQPVELIETYAQLVEWGKRAGTLTARAAAQLLRAAATRPHAAETARRTAIELRESLYRLFAAHAHRRTPSTADLESLNRYLATASARLHLARDGEGYRWGYARDERALDRMLWPVVEEAADLLTSPGLQRVGQCADERGCGWLFLDTTKNHSRRYCATGDCGAINKARRYYRRQRAVAQ
jgi:predicted RNA-binding Zn ribbon-like protein